MAWFEGFDARHHEVNGIRVFARTGGRRDGPPLLMLHGFPQTHALWHRVAQQLADRFFLVLPDLRGYGDSDKPAGAADHANYSKRTMAADMVALMRSLGHERFALVGHDRGGRVAHRLAVDHPQAVSRLCVIDIAPTLDMYAATDMRYAQLYYHWFHLIQPAPLPEKMIGGDPKFYLHWKLGGWRDVGPQALFAPPPEGDRPPSGGRAAGAHGTDYIEPQALAEYERCFCTPEAIHGACEDYRASAAIDLEHDHASREAGQKIECDMLVLWGRRGVVELLFDPLRLWRAQCSGNVDGIRVPAGHFIPEELPDDTAAALLGFL